MKKILAWKNTKENNRWIRFTTDVAKEKQHTALLQGVENFQTSSLRRTNTVEKIVLPNALGIPQVQSAEITQNLIKLLKYNP